MKQKYPIQYLDNTPPADRSPVRIENDTLFIPMGHLRTIERDVILATFQRCAFNKQDTCRTLGISLKTLYNRLHAYKAPLKPTTQLDLFDNPPEQP